MFDSLPRTVTPFMTWSWSQIAPYFEELEKRPLTPKTISPWLADWTYLSRLLQERFARLNVATTVDTTDAAAEEARNDYLENIYPKAQTAEQLLKEKLLASSLEPDGMAVPIQKMRTDAELFREINLPLLTEEMKLGNAYNKMIGAQTVTWKGETKTLTQLRSLMQTPDRAQREQMWRLMAERQLEDRQALNELWGSLLAIRRQIALNAGFENYLDYRWLKLKRFDYAPEDSREFHGAIKQVVVPAANRVYETVRQALDVDQLRPWDMRLDVYPITFPAPQPMANVSELDARAARIFHQVDSELGAYFDTMRDENLLDLENRPGKAPGGYATYFPVTKRPFIFMNAVGTADDVKTMLHEAGHAFHGFETSALPYVQQRHPGAEFSEVASMSMELLAAPYLTADKGGYYQSKAEAARHRIDHLYKIITFWPYMAVVDAFQHWVYQNMDAAAVPANCDAKWSELWQEFIPAIKWDGLENELVTGWHRKLHIFRYPFYYVEYGMAQVGAIQVWRNARQDKQTAVQQYRNALALGGTRSLPALYRAVGAPFIFDEATMRDVIDLLQTALDELEGEL